MRHNSFNQSILDDEKQLASSMAEFCNLTIGGIKEYLTEVKLYSEENEDIQFKTIIPETCDIMPHDGTKIDGSISDRWCYVFNEMRITCDAEVTIFDWQRILENNNNMEFDSFIINSEGEITFFDE